MKKLSVVLAAGLLSASLVAPGQAADNQRSQAQPDPRSETQPYNYVEVGAWGGRGAFGGAVFETQPHERFVSIHIEDLVSDNVYFRVQQNLDNDRSWEVEHEFCGTSTDEISIKGGYYVYVHFVDSVPPICDGGPHFVTTGTATATFSN